MSTDEPPTSASASRHLPVMLPQVLETLAPKDGEVIVDGTFGAGGYTTAILEAAATRVLAFDRDPRAVAAASPLLSRFGERLMLIEAPFGTMGEQIPDHAPGGKVDGIVLDIGVSSMQLDEADRGFSFQHDGPLDMRMSADGPTAADIVNTMDEEPLANILYDFGEEKKSRAIARSIARQRAETPLATTHDLVRAVTRVLGPRRDGGSHPATRTFQALRIYVNDELGELTRALEAAEEILKPGGRLVVVTFHSLEDRIVKRFFIEKGGRESHGSRHLPPTVGKNTGPSFQIVNSRPLSPCQPELDLNPRARSARLRWGVRT